MKNKLYFVWVMPLLILSSCAQVQDTGPVDEKQLADRARSLIISYTYSESPLLRSHAIESLASAKQLSASQYIFEGLSDEYWGVRFTACMAIMKLKCDKAKPLLLKRIQDENKSVRAAAAGALHVLGNQKFTSILGKTLFDKDPVVRRNTALVLGRMGQKGALKLLRAAARDDDLSVRLQVLEAMAMLGNKRAQRLMMSSYCRSSFDDECILAMLALAQAKCTEAKDQIAEIYENTKLKSRLGMKLVAARALAMLGDDRGTETARQALKYKSKKSREQTTVRKLAAIALSETKDKEALYALSKTMEENNPDLQIASALAILKISYDPLPF